MNEILLTYYKVESSKPNPYELDIRLLSYEIFSNLSTSEPSIAIKPLEMIYIFIRSLT